MIRPRPSLLSVAVSPCRASRLGTWRRRLALLPLLCVLAGLLATGRARAANDFGVANGTPTERSVNAALAWFAGIQDDDGSWGKDPAKTGMVLIAFLDGGKTPLSKVHGDNVQRAMEWLAAQMMTQKNAGNPYVNGIVVYALAKAYGRTRIPFLKDAMEKGLDFIIKGQQPGGGFDYNYAKGQRWDLSVAGWQFMAMATARDAGSENPDLPTAIAKGVQFIKSTYANKKFGYASPGSGGNMTGIGTLCLQAFNEGNSAEARGGISTIAKERLPLYKDILAGKSSFADNAGGSIYGWRCDTMAMRTAGGADWTNWRKVYAEVLTKHQDRAGYWEVKKGPGMGDANDQQRIFSTAWCLIQLEVDLNLKPRKFNLAKWQARQDAKSATPNTASDGENDDDDDAERPAPVPPVGR